MCTALLEVCTVCLLSCTTTRGGLLALDVLPSVPDLGIVVLVDDALLPFSVQARPRSVPRDLEDPGAQ